MTLEQQAQLVDGVRAAADAARDMNKQATAFASRNVELISQSIGLLDDSFRILRLLNAIERSPTIGLPALAGSGGA